MANDMTGACCRYKHTPRSEETLRALQNRLSRISGQIGGIKAMLEDNRYCGDILTQVAAVNAALNSFNKVLLANHIETCVVEDIRAGKEGVVEELVNTMQKLMR